jgi:ribosomal protein L24E
MEWVNCLLDARTGCLCQTNTRKAMLIRRNEPVKIRWVTGARGVKYES